MTERDRLASLFGALVSSADVASGFHPEKAIRTAILSARLAEAHGVDPECQSDAYYLALVRFLGCTAFAPEAARFGGGNDLSVGPVMAFIDSSGPLRALGSIVTRVGKGAPIADRVKGLAVLLSDRSAPRRHASAECDVGEALARRIGMSESIVSALGDVFERFDGKGQPVGKLGEQASLLARIVVAADVLEIAFSRFGLAGALATARKRAGGQFDPDLVSTFCDNAPVLLDTLMDGSAWDAFLAAEPAPHQHVTPAVVARYAEAFARAVDLKSVWTATHSHSVGTMAASAGEAAGLDRSSVEHLRVAGWLHDLGRVAVSNLIWDKPGALNEAEWEQMRLHTYHTERLLARSPVLAPIAALAGAAHERRDGSGYIKGRRSSQLDLPARLLAACDVYCALGEDRAHRPAFTTTEAAELLRDEAARGRLDSASVQFVLDVAGAAPTSRIRTWPLGLTDREVEVLRLVAHGGTNKDVARALGISHRTVQHHVSHVYTKTGVTSRAGAALFAAEHDLTSWIGLGRA